MSETYSKVRSVGSGPLGTVYEARDEERGRPVAIKELAPSLAEDEDFLRSVVDQARAESTLDHPNLLRVYGVEASHGVTWILREWAPGGNLEDLLSLRPVQPEPALEILRDVLLGLEELHRQGRIHGNLKPRNVLRCETAWKVSDPLAFEAADPALRSGLPRYTAPECLETGIAKPASDLYSLGLLVYELVVGRERFEREVTKRAGPAEGGAPADEPQVWFRFHLGREELPPLDEVDETVAPEVAELVRRMTAKSPEERYASCGEVLRDLDELLAALESGGAGRSRFASVKLLAGIGAGAAAVLALLFVILAGPSSVAVRVTSEPSGASVAVGGRPLGQTPIPELRLPAGTVVTLSLAGFEDAVVRPSPETPRLHADLVPKPLPVSVTSEPAGALVQAGAETLGVTPLAEVRVVVGTELVVKKAGFEDGKVRLTSAEARELHVDLVALAPEVEEPTPVVEEPAPVVDLLEPFDEAEVRSLPDLVRELVRLATPAEQLRITLDSAADGSPSRLPVGTPVRFRLESERAGFVALFILDSEGLLSCLYPQRRKPPFEIGPGESLTLPPEDEKRRLTARPPLGRDFVFALLTPAAPELPAGDSEASRELHLYPWRRDRTVNPAVELVRWLNERRREAPGETRLSILEIDVTAR